MDRQELIISEVGTYLERYCDSVCLDDLRQLCSVMRLNGHLAILNQPYLDKIFEGRKTIESRFTKVKIPPYRRISVGDVIFLKEAAGPITGLALVANVEFLGPLNASGIQKVMKQYEKELALESSFKDLKRDSRYATLIYISQVIKTSPLPVSKRDRRSWIILSSGYSSQKPAIQLNLLDVNSKECT